ncbi:Rne/Rng family ribonuclease [Altererythrobacter xixiisoli]|uniref:Ribonuclease E n=1 Tax=Croceibacterium xixiisoli TaxID=1476466 RepID=A0A6I4TVN1_9SPHN|nr:Rne/Rng family ribonuclease [Croceibacterium xixiisoli]MXO99872.1 Rne/Rng family ribonuclease [Croceibacterium xixiisoli]
MATRMFIDARHSEETRVAVLKGNRIEEFDFESAEHKQIKGNIYLAKVTRVEPSLQAAFVDFGGNRHGFLAFSEIHPDYYQIPSQDREALLAEEQAHADEEAALRAAEEDEEDGEDFEDNGNDGSGVEEIDAHASDEVATIEDGHVDHDDDEDHGEDDGEHAAEDNDNGDEGQSRDRRGRGRRQGRGGNGRAKEMDELRAKRQALRRRYKIQDVIQRRQVLLVQVVKEERGNKGAALTTYLSLAGRYCVLMPNSSHGGGISRKINSAGDRKRLKQIVSELSLPRSMGLIVRTAGLQRTKTEIKRDFDYLARLWDEIRENTMASSAPALIHSDSDLIKRAIRDIYNRDIEEVIVEGEEGYKSAKAFMKLLMPSHARRVKAYSDPVPLFQRAGAEDQLSAMYDPVVQLKSGGYLVINPTEALVSIDINSGRSTKEHGIEQTALNTNLEAAREIARQLRLRDMAGLVVIDFIDMEYGSNVRKVEKAMKESLKNDRARIQVGRISGFGLMEMSRQRLRTGVLEATTRSCPHCDGTGLVRTASSAGLSALRLIEDEAAKGKGTVISLFASTEAAIYLLNTKRADLAEIELRYGVTVEVIPEGEDEGAKMRAASSGPRPAVAPRFDPIIEEDDDDLPEDIDEDEDEAEEKEAAEESREAPGEDDEGRRKRRRRRRGGRNRNRQREDGEGEGDDAEAVDDANGETEDGADEAADGGSAQAGGEAGAEAEDGETPRRRRRRGGRRRRKQNGETSENGDALDADEASDDTAEGEEPAASDGDAEVAAEAQVESEASETVEAVSKAAEPEAVAEVEAAPAAKPKRTRRKKADAAAEVPVEAAEAPAAEAPAEDATAEEAPTKPKRTRRKKADAAPAEPAADEAAPAEEAPVKPKRTRRKKADPVPEAPTEAPAVAEADAVVEAADETPPAHATAAGDEGTAQNAEAEDDDNDGPPRRGWWQRTFGA